ncbi:MAG: M14 family zinc carboxypeptidase [Halomonas sp.]|uniref:M14 family zinc carboxypeptidase n=1 Tax=Halomonas sp. TaxID=1486246 RepID=UPI003F91B437
MGAPEIPDFNEYRFAEGETRQVIEKHNLQMGALNTFAEGLVDYVKEQGEALLVAGGVIFPTVAAGMAAASDGSYFYAESGATNASKTLYQRLSDTQYRKVADDPSVEFLEGVAAAQMVALELASRADAERTAFNWGKESQSKGGITPLLIGDAGTYLLAADNGFIVNPVRKLFKWPSANEEEFFVNLSGRRIARFDSNGQPIVDYKKTFAWKNDALSGSTYLHVDKNGVVFESWDAAGARIIGGSGLPSINQLPRTDQHINSGAPWLNKNMLEAKPDYDNLYAVSARDVFATHLDVYAYLDQLIAEFTDYVTSEVLGVDEWGSEIKAYTFRAADYSGAGNSYPQDEVDYPRIVISGGTHGNEPHAAKANIHFVSNLCRRWKEDERLSGLRWSCEIVLIPIVCPSGYNAMSRKNGNGVDPNRNYPADWENGGSSNPSSWSYKGTAPASELETQIITSVMQLGGIDAWIDHHRFTSLNNDSNREVVWMGVREPRPIAIAAKMITHDVSWVRAKYDYIWQDNSSLGRLAQSSNGTVARQATAEGIDGYLLETPNHFLQGGTFDIYRHATEAVTHLAHLIHKVEMDSRTLSIN